MRLDLAKLLLVLTFYYCTSKKYFFIRRSRYKLLSSKRLVKLILEYLLCLFHMYFKRFPLFLLIFFGIILPYPANAHWWPLNKHAGTYRLLRQAASLRMVPVSVCTRILPLFAEFEQQNSPLGLVSGWPSFSRNTACSSRQSAEIMIAPLSPFPYWARSSLSVRIAVNER